MVPVAEALRRALSVGFFLSGAMERLQLGITMSIGPHKLEYEPP